MHQMRSGTSGPLGFQRLQNAGRIGRRPGTQNLERQEGTSPCWHLCCVRESETDTHVRTSRIGMISDNVGIDSVVGPTLPIVFVFVLAGN